jgi:hypothetical protein
LHAAPVVAIAVLLVGIASPASSGAQHLMTRDLRVDTSQQYCMMGTPANDTCFESENFEVNLIVAPANVTFGESVTFSVGFGPELVDESWPITFDWTQLPPGCSPLASSYRPASNNISYVECAPIAPGNFTISVQPSGNEAVSGYVNVHPPPAGELVAVANENRSTILANQSVRFTAYTNMSGAPYSYSWDFGDGTANSTRPLVSHAYGLPGLYFPSLTVNNSTQRTSAEPFGVDVLPDVDPYNFSIRLPRSHAVEIGANSTLELNVTFESPFAPYYYTWTWGEGQSYPCYSNPNEPWNPLESNSSTVEIGCRPPSTGNYQVNVTVGDYLGRSAFATTVISVSVMGGGSPPSPPGTPPPGSSPPPSPPPTGGSPPIARVAHNTTASALVPTLIAAGSAAAVAVSLLAGIVLKRRDRSR